MKYPILPEGPRKLGAAAHYTYQHLESMGVDVPKTFTFKDKHGEEYSLYKQDLHTAEFRLPRNVVGPDFCFDEFEGMDVQEDYTLQTCHWVDGFSPANSEQTRVVIETEEYLRHHYTGTPGMVLEAPTGFGKTWCGAAIIQRMCMPAVVITTKEDIFEEWKTALSSVLCIDKSEIGEWRGDTVPNEDCEVVVALIQSVCKGYDRYPKEIYERFGLVMVDEVHRMGADKFSDAMWCFPARFRVGLSATPSRKDGRERVFQAHIGEVEVVTDAVPMEFKVICVDTEWDLPTVWQYDPKLGKSVLKPLEIPWGQASRSVKHLKDDTVRNMIIASFLSTALKKGRCTVVLSDTVEHLQIIEQVCIDYDIDSDSFGYYCGISASCYNQYRGKQAKLDAREAATLKPITLATFKMCGEGTNVPWWDTQVLATPKADVKQAVGRILRAYPDKQFPTVLDLCDRDHEVLAAFCGSREKWYGSMGAEVIHK